MNGKIGEKIIIGIIINDNDKKKIINYRLKFI